ncbi:alkaline phosphatase family protein [Actinokineospora enzanensis]|uniref:alkaline phosphatase family protein n=1 Tax=Actinokineospora enzanensis TaxID=155975 RepID=UPI0003748E97|nr:nucleotide pyrophosphatase/phosphodiesterase family protein [Actinokineospora enzanensis]
MDPLVPWYGRGSLAEVVPSVLAGLGVPGMADALGLAGPARVCVLLVDGLGWELLGEYAQDAPFLAALAADRSPITAGFPATTATSVAALGTGTATGRHGMVGYSFAVREELLNALRWHRHGGSAADLRQILVPEEIQPHPTAFERAVEAGVSVRVIVPRELQNTGLSRAVLRGGAFRGVHALGDLVGRTVNALREHDRVLCYTYHADLDAVGHVHGPGSDPWRIQLSFVDHLARAIADRLPRGGALVVTADHGMVPIGEEDRVDIDTTPALRDGLRLVGGEARVRHLYAEPGADPRPAWTEVLGDRAWIADREEAIAAGWFGPVVEDHVRERIGDLVVAARGTLALTRSSVEPRLSAFIGHHGSLTPAEQLIPLLVVTG